MQTKEELIIKIGMLLFLILEAAIIFALFYIKYSVK
jgi:hypothetical protein